MTIENDNHIDKLKPYQFRPGVSGNPGGRPKATFSLTSELRHRLENSPEEREKIVNSLIKLANKPDLPALKEILERIDGKVADRTELIGQLLVATPEQLELANRRLTGIVATEQDLIAEYGEKGGELTEGIKESQENAQ